MGWDDSDDDDWESAADAQFSKKSAAAKTTWEDDDDESEPEDAVVASKPKNENKKPVSKAKSKKDVIKGGKNSTADAEPVDPVAEKLRLQKLVEEEDLAISSELFGEDTSGGSAANPKTKTEFEAFATILGNKLREHEASPHYSACLKALLRVALENSPSTVCKEAATLCNTQCAEKQRKEKEEANKGKKKKTKASLQKDHGDFMDAGLGHDDYADVGFDDGDFM